MKLSKEIVDKVEETLIKYRQPMEKSYFDNSKLRYIIIIDHFIPITPRQLRAAIQELRTSGRVRCLIASGNGYKFATTTLEMEVYLKRLHKEAMQLLRLFNAEKSQAEIDLGLQTNFEFYNELYKQKR